MYLRSLLGRELLTDVNYGLLCYLWMTCNQTAGREIQQLLRQKLCVTLCMSSDQSITYRYI
ncbi:hypothetical protein GBAR_LOCUS25327, partial [Geodia barretti]